MFTSLLKSVDRADPVQSVQFTSQRLLLAVRSHARAPRAGGPWPSQPRSVPVVETLGV